MNDYPDYVTITYGMRGYFAVLMSWSEEDCIYESWETGIGSYKSAEAAEPEAKSWADAEGIEFR